MNERADITVRQAKREELAAVLDVQHHAFLRVAQELGIEPTDKLPPLQETADDLRRLSEGGTSFFVALNGDSRVVGSVRAESDGEVVNIGRLVVEDGWQRRGVATELMDALEASYPDCQRFVLFTGAEARAPLALYAARGYREFDRQRTEAAELVWLEKRVGGVEA